MDFQLILQLLCAAQMINNLRMVEPRLMSRKQIFEVSGGQERERERERMETKGIAKLRCIATRCVSLWHQWARSAVRGLRMNLGVPQSEHKKTKNRKKNENHGKQRRSRGAFRVSALISKCTVSCCSFGSDRFYM